MNAGFVQDRINQAVWRSRGALRGYGRASGWTDPGEAAAIAWIAERVRDEPILDVGVGGGRTVPLLKTISADYTAVDYTPELVEICRRNHPGTRVHRMDARDMSAFADESFSLVVFSYNGIDAVDHDGRMAILKEFARVLRPGGFTLLPRRSANPFAIALDAARIAYSLPVGAFNYFRNSRFNRVFDGYAMRVCAAHKFGILIMYTDFATQQRQLADVGLKLRAAFGGSSGEPVRRDQDLGGEAWLHFVASKPCG
ncbi:type 11 methyltransferase [Burkholderia pseudomallei]|uniref:class I SAM-dependent methyltransferase n=1 Tax=Burkholderia pseudomallei TaxID=28450 RepID=UPI000F08EA1F|nr:class I SAM-dependent methyltransferase [Burkholderia pseudomallei]VBW00297.1 type 11 methyltransferase [Burkholderia pseudomallei]